MSSENYSSRIPIPMFLQFFLGKFFQLRKEYYLSVWTWKNCLRDEKRAKRLVFNNFKPLLYDFWHFLLYSLASRLNLSNSNTLTGKIEIDFNTVSLMSQYLFETRNAVRYNLYPILLLGMGNFRLQIGLIESTKRQFFSHHSSEKLRTSPTQIEKYWLIGIL